MSLLAPETNAAVLSLRHSMIFGLFLSVTVGCAGTDPHSTASVAKAWQGPAGPPAQTSNAASTGPTARTAARPAPNTTKGGRTLPDPVATIDGRAMPLARITDLLFESRGVQVLEQLIVLEAAEKLAAQRGLDVGEGDFQREYQLTLHRLINALPTLTDQSRTTDEAERVLDAVLAERNLSREEFRLGIRRNAYLRRLAEADLSITDEDLQSEFARSHGTRVRVRHLQLATLGEVARMREQLAAGADFAELARKYSANSASADLGGLLEPFSADDEQVPLSFRQAAFALQPGSVSDAVRVGAWLHILKHEQTLSGASVAFAQVEGEVRSSLRERRTEQDIPVLYAKLLREANVQIHDPVLRAAYQRDR